MVAFFIFISNTLRMFVPADPAEATAFTESTGVDWSWVPEFVDPLNVVPTGVRILPIFVSLLTR
jgi:hypothetical protein